MKKFCLIDDSVSGVGGTMLTLNAITEGHENQIDFIPTFEFSLKDAFSKRDIFIFGNLTSFTKNSLDAIIFAMENNLFVKIDFDYGYCKNRGRIPHKVLSGGDCDCRSKDGPEHLKLIYDLIKEKALHTFYMSEGQMKIHSEDLNWPDDEKRSVLSSCFSTSNLLRFKELKKTKKNNKYAIIDGNGGWHTEAKGVKESIAYAKENGLDFDLIKTESQEEMLDKLSQYKGLITMPKIHDTCPRITIEARYMGLEVVTNTNSQHITEDWWKDTDENAYSFTESRPKYFWNKIKCLN